MAEVIPFPKPEPELRAATCGCGGQTFILVVAQGETPDFVYCTSCQHRQSRIIWDWAPDQAS